MQSLGDQLKEIKPYVLRWISESGSQGGGFAPSPHDMTSGHHTGSISDAQGPQFLKTDGTRALTGNLTVSVGITIDGVDISAHAADPAAHHVPFEALLDDSSNVASPDGNRRIRIEGGNGANTVFGTNKITVHLDTPSTLSVSSANSASSGHSHAITSSSDPGVAASLLATNASGQLELSGRLNLKNTTEALRISFDGSNYTSLFTTSGGNFRIAPTGDVEFNPTGKDIMPLTGYDLNLGSLTKKYLTLHAAELWVETLVAQDTLATIGGRILVGPTTTLTADLTGNVSPPQQVGTITSAGPGSITDTDSLSLPTGYTTGDMLVAVLTSNAPSETIVTPASGWTFLRSDSGNGKRLDVYYRITDGSESGTQSWVWNTSTGRSSFMFAVAFVDANTPFNVSAGNTGNASTALAGGVVPDRNYCAMFAIDTSGAASSTAPNGFAELLDTTLSSGVHVSLYQRNSNVGQSTYTPAITLNTSSGYVATTLVINAKGLRADIQTKHNNLAVDDIVYLEANGSIEFMQIKSGPSGSGPYTYNVQRDRDATGVNAWAAGDAIFNTGVIGSGFIDLYSTWGAGNPPLDTIFNYNNNGAGSPYTGGIYSSNLAQVTGWTMYEASDVTNDSVYFGCLAPFFSLQLEILTAGTGGPTITWEYFNGTTAGWSSFTPTTTGGPFTSTGLTTVSWLVGNLQDWRENTINGTTRHWIRARISSGTFTIKPVLTNKRVTRTRKGYGPTIVMNTRQSITTFNNWVARTAMGNLNGLYGYGTDIYGFAAGRDASNWFSIEETNGFRIFQGNVLKAQWDVSGNIIIGRAATGESNLFLSSGGVQARTNTTVHIDLQTDGDVFIGENTAAAATTNLAIFTAAQTYNSESMAAGDFLIGDNSSSKANIKWVKSEGKLRFRAGTTTHAYINTTGAFTTGDDRVILDNTGLTIIANGTNNELRFKESTTRTAEIYSYLESGVNAHMTIRANPNRDVNPSSLTVEAFGNDSVGGQTQSVSLRLNTGGSIPFAGWDFRENGTLTGGLYLGATSTPPSHLLELSTDSARKPTTNTWATTSDERTKKNIVPWGGSLDLMLALPDPVEYEYNGKGGTPSGARGLGFSAQEVARVAPSMVKTVRTKLQEEDDDEIDLLTFNPHEILMATPGAIRALHAMVLDLQSKLEKIK